MYTLLPKILGALSHTLYSLTNSVLIVFLSILFYVFAHSIHVYILGMINSNIFDSPLDTNSRYFYNLQYMMNMLHTYKEELFIC